MTKVNINKIAKGLGAVRRGRVESRSGYFGAMELLAEVQRRFQVPTTGGRATDRSLTVQRQIALRAKTYKQLVTMAARLSKTTGKAIGPLQVGTVLLERAAEEMNEDQLVKILAAG